MMKQTPVVFLFLCVSFLLSGCATRPPRALIEEHLGISSEAHEIIDSMCFSPPGDAPDMGLLLTKLTEAGATRNLTVGILTTALDEDLDLVCLTPPGNPRGLKRLLDGNATDAGTTLVRPQDISNVVVQTNVSGRVIGTFDWTVPGQLVGRCRFVARRNRLEYLGFLRRRPVHVFDCATVFYRNANVIECRQWPDTEYFAAIEPKSSRARQLKRGAQQEDVMAVLRAAKLTRFRFAYLPGPSSPLVYCGDREDRNEVIRTLEGSADWCVTRSGRAVWTLEYPLHRSIERQIKGLAGPLDGID